MDIKCLKVGLYQCNCYIIKKDNKVLVIDPGDEYEKIIKEINDKEILGILITHSHSDHIGALKKFNNTKYKFSNLEEKTYEIGPFMFEVIFTPGHSNDSVTYYFKEDKVMFTGDFLFHNDIGRCDLATGDINKMRKSIDKIKKYDDDIVIYPGHDEETILGNEKKDNYYFINK